MKAHPTILRSSRVIERIRKSDFLPQGHVERKLARKAADLEYQKCRLLEELWVKQIFPRKKKRNQLLSIEEITAVVDVVCSQLGVRRRPKVKIENCGPYVAGMYCCRERLIQFSYRSRFSTVIHELAHFLCYEDGLSGRHGKDFMMVEELAFMAYQESRK